MMASAGADRGLGVGRGPFLLHVALSAVAIAQPFYSVTGIDLNFFVAWRMSGLEFATWILLIYAVPPLVTYLLVSLGARLHRRLGLALSLVIFSAYIWLAVVNVTRQLTHQIPLLPDYEQIVIGGAFLALSVTLAWLLLSKPGLRGVVRLFAVMTVVFPALVLLRGYEFGVLQLSKPSAPSSNSRASRYVLSNDRQEGRPCSIDVK